jgi:hypothetical protein
LTVKLIFLLFLFLDGFRLGPERSGQRPHLIGNNRISSPGSRPFGHRRLLPDFFYSSHLSVPSPQ